MSDLESIGYSDWFASRVDAEKVGVHGLARIVTGYMRIFMMMILMPSFMVSYLEKHF